MRGREVADRASQKASLAHDDLAFRDAAVPDMRWRSEYLRFAWPPPAGADDIGMLLDLPEVGSLTDGLFEVAIRVRHFSFSLAGRPWTKGGSIARWGQGCRWADFSDVIRGMT